jgi:cyclic beta-1,2-glucan synthetase
MVRVALEGLLGFCVKGTHLHLDPCIPRAWPGFEIAFRHGVTRYRITVDNPQGVSRGVLTTSLDGVSLVPGAPIPLVDDGVAHHLHITLGA